MLRINISEKKGEDPFFLGVTPFSEADHGRDSCHAYAAHQ
jgi:hypothetical protein